MAKDGNPYSPGAAAISKRRLTGILLLDKPMGLSSNGALQRVKRLFNAAKAGHTGSLDPLATGLLPICFGEATKFSQYLLDADKAYQVTLRLGVMTDTGDAEGAIISEQPIPPLLKEQVASVLSNLLGPQEQVPPMYSALKHQGQPLYKLAREGKTVTRAPRAITIYRIALLAQTASTLTLEVFCSKGTYIRTLVEAIGTALGCGAHVTALRRFQVGHFYARCESDQFTEQVESGFDWQPGHRQASDWQAMPSLDQLQQLAESQTQAGPTSLDSQLLPLNELFFAWPEAQLTPEAVRALRFGQQVVVADLPPPRDGKFVLIAPNSDILGVGKLTADGKIAPERLIATD